MPLCRCKANACGSIPNGKVISLRLWKAHQRQDIISENNERHANYQTFSARSASASGNHLSNQESPVLIGQSTSAVRLGALEPLISDSVLYPENMPRVSQVERSISYNRAHAISRQSEGPGPRPVDHADFEPPQKDIVNPISAAKTSVTTTALDLSPNHTSHEANPVIAIVPATIVDPFIHHKTTVPFTVIDSLSPPNFPSEIVDSSPHKIIVPSTVVDDPLSFPSVPSGVVDPSLHKTIIPSTIVDLFSPHKNGIHIVRSQSAPPSDTRLGHSAIDENVESMEPQLTTIDIELKQGRITLAQLYQIELEEFNFLFVQHEARLLSREEILRKYSSNNLPTAIFRLVSPLLEEVEDQFLFLSRCRNERLYKINHHITSSYFHHTLKKSDPILVSSLISAAIPYLLGGASRKFSNIHLRGNIMIMDLASETKNEERLNIHPSDIRTARKLLQLDPILHIYACCPRCSSIYPPELVPVNMNIKSTKNTTRSLHRKYPPICVFNPFPADPNSLPCQTDLLRELDPSQDDSPLRPFVFQNPKEFLGRLLARRDMELLMDQAWSTNIETEYLTDIFRTEVCQTFVGSDGLTFRAAANKRGEGRYLFALFVDWFNPYTNKAAGPIASVGTISMVCLNLPLDIRYKQENMYLVGLIPGPKEPSMEEADHFLKPLIDTFKELWDPGIYFEQTAYFRTGKKVNAAIVALMGDLKALRKISGNAQCQVCHLSREKVKKGTPYTDFPLPLTDTEYRAFADKWMNAPDRTTRDKIYRENGIRWTPLLQLPYWRPSCFAIVDVMHALFLGIIPTHFRHIYGMDGIQADIMEKTSKTTNVKKSKVLPLDESNVRRGEELINSPKLSFSALLTLRHATLKHLCSVYLPSKVLSTDITRRHMAQSLIEWHTTHNSQSVSTGRILLEQTSENSNSSTNLIANDNASKLSKLSDAEHYELAEKVLMKPTPTSSLFARYRQASLYALCQVYLPEKLEKGKKYKKTVLIDLLCNWRKNQPSTIPKQIQPEGFDLDLPEPISLTQPILEADTWSGAILDGKTLLEIRSDIGRITVPTWIEPLTSQFGSKRKGKLKADAWRTAATIYLPITLVRLWGSQDSSEMSKKYLANTMLLLSAVILITSSEITSVNATQYTKYMQEYLDGLRDLFPDVQFRDNHHVSLHLEFFVKVFGPVQCWWTFPFERVIGVLEKYNTNWKMGQMEQTMLSTFCAAANLRTLLNTDFSSFPALQSALKNVHQSVLRNSKTSLLDDNDSLDTVPDGTHGHNLLPDMLSQALASYLGSSANLLSKRGQLFKRITHRGLQYSTRAAALRDSFIMVKPTRRPAQIEFIFTHDELPFRHFYACIRKFKDTELDFDPYNAFPILQARIYSSVLDEYEILDFNDVWCHFAHNQYDNGNIVALPLDRVGSSQGNSLEFKCSGAHTS